MTKVKNTKNLNHSSYIKDITESWNERVKETESKLGLFEFDSKDCLSKDLGLPIYSNEG